jgi:hypothetical protein
LLLNVTAAEEHLTSKKGSVIQSFNRSYQSFSKKGTSILMPKWLLADKLLMCTTCSSPLIIQHVTLYKKKLKFVFMAVSDSE